MPNRNRVFVLDDDPSMLLSVARLLRQFDCGSVLFTSAGAFAIHKDFENVRVLLDINSDVGGLELRDRLKAANIAVVYMSGNDSPGFRAAALQSGCLAYLTKPFSAASLVLKTVVAPT